MTTSKAPHVDLLTAAYKRDHLVEELARAVADARRAGTPLTLLYFDVDETLEHNDLHGQDSTDAALARIAVALSDELDGRGPIGRMGGDEFCVILERTSKGEGDRLAQRIIERARQLSHASPGGPFRMTCSVGVAELRPSEPPFNLLEGAEEACRRAKQAGRDVVVSR